ncbi:uncharacterized protein LOC113797406 isoform X3 [Dermatophagoides pteronyssinus]
MVNVVVKIIDKNRFKNEFDYRMICAEIDTLKNLHNHHHRNIARLLQFDEIGKNLFIVQEYCSRGDLNSYMKKFSCENEINHHKKLLPIDEVIRIFIDLVECLTFVQENCGLYHGAIKPANILFDHNNQIKLIGFCPIYLFGHKDRRKSENLVKIQYSEYDEFQPPECWSSSSSSSTDNKRYRIYMPTFDVWSCGILLYEMLTNSKPFTANMFEKNSTILKQIKSGIFQNRKQLTLLYGENGVLDLIGQMLEINPMKRIRMKQILQHSWIKYGWSHSIDINSYDKSDSNLMTLPETMTATIYSKNQMETEKFRPYYHEITNEKLDNDILVECLRLHGNEVNDVLELRSNILYKHCYHTATYWLIQQNIDYYNKVLYTLVTDLVILFLFILSILTQCKLMMAYNNNDRDRIKSKNIVTCNNKNIVHRTEFFENEIKSDQNCDDNLKYIWNGEKEFGLFDTLITTNDFDDDDDDDDNELLDSGIQKDFMNENIFQKSKIRHDSANFSTGLYHHESNNFKQSNSIMKYGENCHLDVDDVDNYFVWKSKRNGKCFQENVVYHEDDDKITSTTTTSTTNDSNDDCCLLNEEFQNYSNESKLIANNENVNDEKKKKSSTRKLIFSELTKKFTSNISRINSLLNFPSHSHHRSNPKGSLSCTNSPCKTSMNRQQQRSYDDQINIYDLADNGGQHCPNSFCTDHFRSGNDLVKMNEHHRNKKSSLSISNFWQKHSVNQRIYDKPIVNICNSGNNSSLNSCSSSSSTSTSYEKHTSSSTLIITSYDCYDDCIQAAIHILKKKGINFKKQTTMRNGTRQLRCCISTSNKVILVFRMDFFQTDPRMFILIRMKKIRGQMNDFQIICNNLTKYFQTESMANE